MKIVKMESIQNKTGRTIVMEIEIKEKTTKERIDKVLRDMFKQYFLGSIEEKGNVKAIIFIPE